MAFDFVWSLQQWVLQGANLFNNMKVTRPACFLWLPITWVCSAYMAFIFSTQKFSQVCRVFLSEPWACGQCPHGTLWPFPTLWGTYVQVLFFSNPINLSNIVFSEAIRAVCFVCTSLVSFFSILIFYTQVINTPWIVCACNFSLQPAGEFPQNLQELVALALWLQLPTGYKQTHHNVLEKCNVSI